MKACPDADASLYSVVLNNPLPGILWEGEEKAADGMLDCSGRNETVMATHSAPPARRPRSLVTGGAGFLGSHLCDRLIAEGHEVICLDSLLTGSLENMQHLIGNPRFTFVRADATQPMELGQALSSTEGSPARDNPSGGTLDYILHLASPASPVDYDRYPIETLRAGAMGTYQALELARAHGSVFLLASSSEVYGDPEISPQVETYWGHVNPIGPRSVYDEAKRFAESLAVAYARKHGVAVRIARIFNTYGERMRVEDGRVLPNFLRQALRDQPVTVYGDGSQTRSFCYVSDMVEGLYRLLLSEGSEPAEGTARTEGTEGTEPTARTEPVNLGNPEEVTILELAREVIALTGSRSQIAFRALPADDPQRRRPDIRRAVRTLRWQPTVARHEGITRVIPYFQGQLRLLSAPSS